MEEQKIEGFDKLVAVAERSVSFAMEEYNGGNKAAFLYLLGGVEPLKVELHKGEGHNYQAVAEGIYKYYAANPESGVDKVFEEFLTLAASRAVNYSALNWILNYVDYQLDCEEKGTAPFKLNAAGIAETVKESVAVHKEALEASNEDFAGWLKSQDEYLFNRHQLHIC